MGYFFSILFGTFLLEDVALAASLVLVNEGKMTWIGAYGACFLGISLGDLGLYGMGYAASRFEAVKQHQYFKKYEATMAALSNHHFLSYSIIISRFIPGTRWPTYVGAGLLGYTFFRFFILTIVSVSLWVFLAFLGGQALLRVVQGNWLWVLVSFLLVLAFLKSICGAVINPWYRKALVHSWRRWMHFEFWPAWFFYLPIIPYYIYRSFIGRSFLLPFYSNPRILNGGLIGESKWDFLKHLKADEQTTLKAEYLHGDLSADDILKKINSQSFSFPFILKPDIGQRGYGVRIISSESELRDYVNKSRGISLLVQAMSSYQKEAGIFYYRMPNESLGVLFSITDKKFPFVIGDGKNTLGDLILQDRRARIIARTYFERHKKNLNTILTCGHKFILAECGNHCQGAIFTNGKNLMSEKLLEKIDQLAKSVPDFYFGRIDVRYKDAESLKQGCEFEVIEINGAGSEATHIWDPNTKLFEAYRVLFKQWKVLFTIGSMIKKQKRLDSKVQLWLFLYEFFRVVKRHDSLSISS